MAANHKLTGVLKGRTLKSAQSQDGKVALGFDDGSTLTVKVGAGAGGTTSAATGGKVAPVTQADTRLTLVFEDGAKQDIALAEATSSVMVRDKGGGPPQSTPYTKRLLPWSPKSRCKN